MKRNFGKAMRLFAIFVCASALGCGSNGASSSMDGGVDGGVVPDGGDGSQSILDLAEVSTGEPGLLRVLGSAGNGELGAPVAAGGDCDGDQRQDVALASFLASPLDRNAAGEVYVVFGDGRVEGEIDTAPFSSTVLKIAGAAGRETLGNEIWIDDVTGDGVAEVLLGRQNYRPPLQPSGVDRPGAGALTILVGGPALREHAETGAYLDLQSPPSGVTLTTLVGAEAIDRLGIWFRTADVTGDGIADIIVGADQEDVRGENSGATYVIRGGVHLAANRTIDLADFGSTAIAGHIAKVLPPENARGYHLGATCFGADLDGNGRAEVLTAAALQRAGASVSALGAPPDSAEAIGGTPQGSLFIAWDDNFEGDPWPDGYTVALDGAPGATTVIHGGTGHRSFGEELNGGDFDGDGRADLFVGDLIGDLSENGRASSGVGHVLYDAGTLKGLTFDMNAPPTSLAISTLLGAAIGDISSDTSVVGDFNGDSIDDLATGSPSADPGGRSIAGTIHVVFGQDGPWPSLIDLANPEAVASQTRITTIVGANGTQGSDLGDMICYSAAGGDIDEDGRDDIVSNEMLGNGLDPAAIDVGNLVVIGGTLFD